MFEVPEAWVTDEQRRIAKAVGHSTLYGQPSLTTWARQAIPKLAYVDWYFVRWLVEGEEEDVLLDGLNEVVTREQARALQAQLERVAEQLTPRLRAQLEVADGPLPLTMSVSAFLVLRGLGLVYERQDPDGSPDLTAFGRAVMDHLGSSNSKKAE